MSRLDEIVNELKKGFEKSAESLRRDLAKIRGGRAHAAMFESVRVDYYGVPTPIEQMATISVPEPRLITIKPWEQSQLKNIDKAIRESDLSLNPQVDGDLIRISIPALSDTRRKEMVKLAKKYAEECKVAMRRRYLLEANEQIEQLEADGELNADDATQARSMVEQLGAVAIKQIDEMVAAKEKEILTG